MFVITAFISTSLYYFRLNKTPPTNNIQHLYYKNIYSYFGTYNTFATTGNYFNRIIIQCVNVTQLILYTCISLDVFPEYSNHAFIYFYYKGILILFDKLLNNLCEFVFY